MLKFNPNGMNEDTHDSEELPWLVFMIKNNLYAINSGVITAISIIPEEITPIPESPEYIIGIINIRGDVIPVIDTRTLFHLKSIKTEHHEFKEMMDERKVDHINWVNELVKCYKTGEKFTLATDPHMCKFGIWYDNFETDNNQILFQLKQVEIPHNQLHESAQRLQDAIKNQDGDVTPESIIEELQKNTCPQIIKCLDETVAAVKDNSKGMIITLKSENDDKKIPISLIVDQVLSVEKLNFLCDNQKLQSFHETKFVNGVAKCDKYPNKLISLINQDTMLDISSKIEF